MKYVCNYMTYEVPKYAFKIYSKKNNSKYSYFIYDTANDLNDF